MQDQRHQRREELFQKVFACTFTPARIEAEKAVAVGTIAELLAELPVIDEQIARVAPERPLADVSKVDLAILRVIVFESTHKNTPKKVLLDEAIELAKAYGAEGSSKFINGALARLLLEE